MNRQRTLLVVVAVAIGSTAVGYAAAGRVHSPDEEAANAKPPAARPVTAAVERRVLESRVVVRGDVVFDGAIDVSVDLTALSGPPIVTATPVDPGDQIGEGQILAEVAGRPVIVLGGDLPVYRDLAPGMVGPDVAQLEAGLHRIGFDPGPIDDTYDSATGAAVAALYAMLGYPPPNPRPDVAARVDAARAAADAANETVRTATRALDDATAGPTTSERLSADAAVDDAQRALDEASAAGDQHATAAAAEQVAIAKAQRTELLAGPDSTHLKSDLADAKAALDRANVELLNASLLAATPLPAAELAFIPSLPRRVDSVAAQRGRPVDGPIARVTGVDLVVRAPIGSADRKLIAEGMPAEVEGGGITTDATLMTLDDDATTGSSTATIALTTPTPETVDSLAGLNVKVTIPIDSTDGAVLAVPLAALTAGGDGRARVEVIDTGGARRLVHVEVGLSADGYAAVRPLDGQTLDEGDPVVVGR
jgi:peptidoglycan hydrolase-like protein with peptidoglycan-binding domain